ncbi:hypothetical protein [Metapseudomonas otitidis]|uniref:hypothetical protein n=1 Tax=Metapseudomonas otitidis TaxID=319939 RepID=UPI00244D786D|nr:hypothetical protein [Pseudomonas otitidis]MDH0335136.1 hypothetical protein [Pseudomonas otitidis]
MSFNPLISLARNAKRQRMEMQCDPQWVLDLAAERDQLRAERDSHQRLCIAEMEKNAQLRAELAAIRGQAITLHQVLMAYDYAEGHPHKYLRGTTNWCAAVAHSLNEQRRLPPQQPDAVSVPRELAERIEARMAECSPMKEHWDTLEELRAILSTKNAEEV